MLEARPTTRPAASRPGSRPLGLLSAAATRLVRATRQQARRRGGLRPAFVLVVTLVVVSAWLTDGLAPLPRGGTLPGTSAGQVPDLDAQPAPRARVVDAQFAGIAASLLGGPYLPDGTLRKPLFVDSAAAGPRHFEVTTYAVRPGDTLTGIAARFGVSMMTIWWANSLASKDVLHVGQQLRIPPVSGILYAVREGDTLDSIAALAQADTQAIREFNGLPSDTLLIGQLLMIPDGVGPPIPTPVPTARPAVVATAPPVVQPLATLTGVASWMYGSGTAARLPIDTLLRICGAGGCVERRVTSWGPTDPDRIVDLAEADFPVVCGCSLSTGLTVVRVDILPG